VHQHSVGNPTRLRKRFATTPRRGRVPAFREKPRFTFAGAIPEFLSAENAIDPRFSLGALRQYFRDTRIQASREVLCPRRDRDSAALRRSEVSATRHGCRKRTARRGKSHG
jgi:hypothetical protein